MHSMELYNVSYVCTEHFIQWVKFPINHVCHCVGWILCSHVGTLRPVKLLSARLLSHLWDVGRLCAAAAHAPVFTGHVYLCRGG